MNWHNFLVSILISCGFVGAGYLLSQSTWQGIASAVVWHLTVTFVISPMLYNSDYGERRGE